MSLKFRRISIGMYNRICPICKTQNTDIVNNCINCGQRLAPTQTNLIKCPICKTSNDKMACYCVSCSQKLRIVQMNSNSQNNLNRKERERSYIGLKNFGVFILAIFLLCLYYQKSLMPLITKIIPQRIVDVPSIRTAINQNSICYIPNKVTAHMNYAGNKAVKIQWTPASIDPSKIGAQILVGKVDGYEQSINFTISVLPHKVINQFIDCTVQNSLLEIKANLPENCMRVWFKLRKQNENIDEVINVENGMIHCKLYLPFNSGEYSLNVLTSDNMNAQEGFYEWKTFKVMNTDKRDMAFLLPEEFVQSDAPQIVELANNIILGCDTDMEKTLAIHDWVATNITYDTEAYFKNKIHNYSAIETLEGGKAVCNGYAHLTAALNRAVNIKAKIISGTAWSSDNFIFKTPQGHAWNETCIAGRWIIQDTTWDAGGVDTSTNQFVFNLQHEYFDPTSSNFLKDHKKSIKP